MPAPKFVSASDTGQLRPGQAARFGDHILIPPLGMLVGLERCHRPALISDHEDANDLVPEEVRRQ